MEKKAQNFAGKIFFARKKSSKFCLISRSYLWPMATPPYGGWGVYPMATGAMASGVVWCKRLMYHVQ